MTRRSTVPSAVPSSPAGCAQPAGDVPGGAAGVLLAAVALLLGVLASAAAAVPGGGPHAASRTDVRHSADEPCPAGCEGVPLLHRGTTAERQAVPPGGTAVPVRAAYPPPPRAGTRAYAAVPGAAGPGPDTVRHRGRAPPPPPGT
ncbi:hypothetical protein CUT44_16575 [Streptomyces carminius]|uniref:Uncharacterized protein n=1 Tax=Streptomyces carminius TaxID=2665496 RepID=A0A2M8LXG0_9ACTN|nr:hypothetical protein [Streptomyces carminius]PJE96658.1 hypothetical protein CUT44_16575 [Streptomyces carminius]